MPEYRLNGGEAFSGVRSKEKGVRSKKFGREDLMNNLFSPLFFLLYSFSSQKESAENELIGRVLGRTLFTSKRVGAISGARPSVGGGSQTFGFLIIRRRGNIGEKTCAPQKNQKISGRNGYGRSKEGIRRLYYYATASSGSMSNSPRLRGMSQQKKMPPK